MAGTGAKAVKLPVEDENVASLRDEDALPGQLLLQTDSAEIRADAHGAGGVETNEGVPRPIADGDGLRLDLGSINVQGELALEAHMNRAGIEGDGQGTPGLEEGEMRRTANADLAAVHKVDARGAGLDAHVTAAAQDGFYLPVDDFHTHGPGDADGFAVDDPHGVGWRFIGARGGRGDQCSAEEGQAGRRKRGAAQGCVRIGEGDHSVNLPATEGESLAYTIRWRLRSRT